MAQWKHQFSDKTHWSKVSDREKLLRHAVEVYRAMQAEDERAVQAKKVLRLAQRLLNARIRAKKARINQLGPRPWSRESSIAVAEQATLEKLKSEGVQGILEEYRASDILFD